MKHIKRKFQSEAIVSKEVMHASLESIDLIAKRDSLKEIKPQKGQRFFYHTINDKAAEAFPIKLNGKIYYIPEPDPVLIYFDSAQRNYRSINDNIKNLLNAFDFEQNKDFYLDSHKVYIHFELVVVFVTSLFTSIEAFTNKMIPDTYEYKDKKSNRTEIYNKDQIQRSLSFDVKINKILREITGKDFKASPKFQHIINLKEFRDSIIHTKTGEGDHTPYDRLFKKSFTFKYEETLHAVRDFINYYSPDFIEECGCGADF